MRLFTTLSAPIFVDSPKKLYTKWKAREGNETKTEADFYVFLASRTLQRDVFLYENTTLELEHQKANIVLSNLIPR